MATQLTRGTGIVGTLKVLNDVTIADDLTVTDDLTIGGDVILTGTVNITDTSTDMAVVRFNGITGIADNSLVIIGDLGEVSGVKTLGASGVVTLTDATASTVSTDGALISAGGVGVAKNIITGTTVDVGTALTVGTTLTVNGNLQQDVVSGAAPVLSAANMTSIPGAGSGIVGPAGATDNAVTRYDGTSGTLAQDTVVLIGDLGEVSGVTTLATNGVATLSDATTSTSTTTGSVKLAGGIGIVENAWIGGTANVAGITTLANTTDSTVSTDGGTIVSGGLGVAKKLFVGTDLSVLGNTTIGNAASDTFAIHGATPVVQAAATTAPDATLANAHVIIAELVAALNATTGIGVTA